MDLRLTGEIRMNEKLDEDFSLEDSSRKRLEALQQSSELLEHVVVLKAINEIPFPVGKNLLADFLTADFRNESISKNNLDILDNFGGLNLEKEEVLEIIDRTIKKELVEVSNVYGKSFYKILKLTEKGIKEMKNPGSVIYATNYDELKFDNDITETDREIFRELGSFLESYNDEQKKIIISPEKNILCIAGAGSGKTAVLTKRIEFLVRYKGVSPQKVLAVTFTRKAKEEMIDRLGRMGISANVETFNSFCEKFLRKYGVKLYGRNVRIAGYGDKVLAVMSSLDKLNLDMREVVEDYFSDSQKRNKTYDQLSRNFVSDCFSIIEYFKSKGGKVKDFHHEIDRSIKNAEEIYNICKGIEEYFEFHGLRDYSDQILDALKLFISNSDLTPEFEHVLVDEYQDVNAVQIELLNKIRKNNLFCVGDPRQSIFGWRGSDINFILNFSREHDEAKVMTLMRNYRSVNEIIQLMNHSLENLSLPNLICTRFDREDFSRINLIDFNTEEEEFDYVIAEILSLNIPREEIFVLARTNRQLNKMSFKMKAQGIRHVLKTDEFNNPISVGKGEITLATIHSIKGLEARAVFVVGCNEVNFPCKASDHPVIEMIKSDDYNKEEEERRLFYVAISRAKERLYLTYTGKKPTYFINDKMMKLLNRG